MATAALPQSAHAQSAAYGLVIFDSLMKVIELQKIAANRPLTKSESTKVSKCFAAAKARRPRLERHFKQANIIARNKAKAEAEVDAWVAKYAPELLTT